MARQRACRVAGFEYNTTLDPNETTELDAVFPANRSLTWSDNGIAGYTTIDPNEPLS